MTRPRVLVVDDSAFARKILSRLITASGKLEVVGTARDGTIALEMIEELDPDVITLDLNMPELDGLGVLRALAGRPRPRALVVSISSVDTELGADALMLGAIDLVAKPTALASDRLNEIGDELVAKLLAAAAGVRPVHAPTGRHAIPRVRTSAIELVMVGTSTGGPQALTRLMAGLPADLAAPVVIVLHIPAGYTEALAARLDKLSKLRVVEANDGLELRPGLAVLARGGSHLRVERYADKLRCRVSPLPLRPFTPSVNELFLSGVGAVGSGALGVILTGMGDDGLEGARAISAAGGVLLAEDAATCVVYGMPRCVIEAELGAASVVLDHMAAEIAKRV